jgi:single-strand DNA-binding protein
MSDFNKAFIIGRLTRDAELAYTASGMAVSKFSLACNEKRKSGSEWVDEVSFFDITLWGKQAESLNQYLTKGKQIAVDGKLKQERWTDRDSSQARSKISVVAQNIQLLGGSANKSGEDQAGNSGANRGNGGRGYGSSPYPSSPPASSESRYSAPAPDDGFEDDIPF